MKKQHYVYMLIDPRTNLPFYVGKGQGRRMYSHVKESLLNKIYWSNKAKCCIINEILQQQLEVKYEQIFCENDQAARELEIYYIDYYGKICVDTGILTNVHGGGGGFGNGGKSVSQYSLDGIFIATFKSAADAGELYNIPSAGINNCCRGKYNTSHGYQWRWSEDNAPGVYIRTSIYKKPVQQFSMTGEFIRNWDGARDAEKALLITKGLVNKCCIGKLPSIGGFKWSYDPSYIVPESVDNLTIDKKIKSGKIVYQYTMQGELIKEWGSGKLASFKLGILHSGISSCCNRKRATAGGYRWSFNKDIIYDQHFVIPNNKRNIRQLTSDGIKINDYYSIEQAANIIELSTSLIINCCRGRLATAGGYKWEYITT